MRLGRPTPPLTTDDERETLGQWARRPKTAQALAQRARMVLECSKGPRIPVHIMVHVPRLSSDNFQNGLAGICYAFADQSQAEVRTRPASRDCQRRSKRLHSHGRSLSTPTSASWLILVERWFGLLTEKQLRRGVHQSSAELEAAIYGYLDITNEDPKPFVWTKTAVEILTRVARFCQRTLNTGH